MPNIFNKPPSKWNGMDWAQFNMLTDNNYKYDFKRPSNGGCGCLTAAIIAFAVLFLFFI